jgi:hypothetical protein
LFKAIFETAFFADVLSLPMLVDGVCHLYQPGTVLEKFQNIRSAEKLVAILSGIAKGFEQTGRNECRNVMRLAVKHPPGLLCREAGGQLPQERQKPLLIFFHLQHQSQPTSKSEQIFPK